MTQDALAAKLEQHLSEILAKKRPQWGQARFTPSIRDGVRYLGVKMPSGQTFFVEINVEEV